MKGCNVAMIESFYDIRQGVNQYMKETHMRSMEEVYTFLYETQGHLTEKRMIREAIYEKCKDRLSSVMFKQMLRYALVQNSYRYDSISDQELVAMKVWVEKNGKKWGEAEKVFNRPSLIIRKALQRSKQILHDPVSFDLIDVSIVLYYHIMFHPQCLFEIKGRRMPTAFVPWKHFKQHYPQFRWKSWPILLNNMIIRTRRIFALEDYKLLFQRVLKKSKAFILDAEVSVHSIRYLNYPVNTLFNHVEYILRLFYLYIYYIDFLPESLTTRTFIEFLQQRLVEEKETIPEHFFNVHPSTFKRVEFTGFPRGSRRMCLDITPEVDKEVKKINALAFPPDEELKKQLALYPLEKAVQHSRIVPSDMDQLEVFHTEDEWKQIHEKEKEKKREKKEKRKQKLERSVVKDVARMETEAMDGKKMKKMKKMKGFVKGMKV